MATRLTAGTVSADVVAGARVELIETLLIAHAGIVFATADVPPESGGDEAAGSSRAWPRLIALCAQSGAVIADCGLLPGARSGGVALTWNAAASHVIAADISPSGAPVLVVWDAAPLLATAGRTRAAFLRAATRVAVDPAYSRGDALNVTLGGGDDFSGLDLSAVSVGHDDTSAALSLSIHAARSSVPSELRPFVLSLQSVGVLDACMHMGGGIPSRIMAVTYMPRARSLAVAHADGTVRLWDAAVKRHRLLYPPNTRVGVSGGADIETLISTRPAAAAVARAPAAAFTPPGLGFTPLTTVPLRFGYACIGRLDAESPGGAIVLPASGGGASRAKSVGLAVLSPVTTHAPARILASRESLDAAAALFSTFAAGGVVANKTGLDTSRAAKSSPTPRAAENDAAGSAATPVADPYAGVSCGVAYVLDDASVITIDCPPSAHFDARLISLSDDVYFAAVASRVFSPTSAAALRRVVAVRARVVRVIFLGTRGTSLSAFGPTLCASTLVNSTGTVVRSAAAAGATPVPTAALPVDALCAALGDSLDAMGGSVGGGESASSAAPRVAATADALAAIAAGGGQAPPITEETAAGVSSAPFFLAVFFAPADGPKSVALLAPAGAAPLLLPATPATACGRVPDGSAAATGVVVTVAGGEGGDVDVALDHEDRIVQVSAHALRRMGGGSGGRLLIGDHVGIAAPSAASALVWNRAWREKKKVYRSRKYVTPPPHTHLPPRYLTDPRKPRATPLIEPISAREADAISNNDEDYSALDVLAFCCDDVSSPGGVPPPADGGGEVRFAGARVRRRVTLWAVGRVTFPTAVQSLAIPDTLEPSSSHLAARLSRASRVFGASAPAWLARAGAGWGAAAAAAHARALARDTATRTAALQLFDSTAKNGGPSDVGVGAGGPTGVVAGALSRALAAAAAGETDSAQPCLRAALGYVWTLAKIAAETAKNAGEKPEWDVPAMWGGGTGDTRVEEGDDEEEDDGGDSDDSRDDGDDGHKHAEGDSGATLPLGIVLCSLAAAAWHWPLIRWALRPLFSLEGSPSAHANKMCVVREKRIARVPSMIIYPPTPPPSRFPTSGPLAAAKAVLPSLRVALLRTLIQSKPGNGSSPRAIARREARSRVTFVALVEAATALSSRAPSLDLLFPLLAYVREGTGSGGAGATVSAGEHIADALVRRRVLPWDPRELEALGVGDAPTRSALGSAALCATPIDAFSPREAAFLLADAPAVATLAPAALGALASTFAGACVPFGISRGLFSFFVMHDAPPAPPPPPPGRPSVLSKAQSRQPKKPHCALCTAVFDFFG